MLAVKDGSACWSALASISMLGVYSTAALHGIQEGLKARHLALLAALEDMDKWLLLGEGPFL